MTAEKIIPENTLAAFYAEEINDQKNKKTDHLNFGLKINEFSHNINPFINKPINTNFYDSINFIIPALGWFSFYSSVEFLINKLSNRRRIGFPWLKLSLVLISLLIQPKYNAMKGFNIIGTTPITISISKNSNRSLQ